uniref:MFS transporter n=1 Tax=Thermosporothrix sp. COM3 TaxID=2490863 RepID=A0A455SA07_9CHLR|nr:MFS transporter [Thermosporothrix sp. COM3]
MPKQRNISTPVPHVEVCLETTTPQEILEKEIPQGNQWLLLVVICLGWFMSALDTTVVNLALKNIGEDLQTDITGLQWAVDGYALIFASLLLTAGGLGDRLGRKRMYLIGLATFTLSSGLCGLAPTYWMLLSARLLQGGGAALMVPNILALIHTLFPRSEQRARAVAFWAVIGAVALAVGPVVGGLLVSLLHWRSIFFLNVPIGIVALLISLPPHRIPETIRHLDERGLDLTAQVMAVVGLASLTMVLIEGGRIGWLSWPILTCLALFIVTGIIFLICEARGRSPMLPLHLFAILTFSVGMIIGAVENFGFYGFIFLLSLFFQDVQHSSALVAGLAFLPMTGSVIVANALTGLLTSRIGPRMLMCVGLALGGSGFFSLLLLDAASPYLVACFGLFAIGMGIGLTIPPLTMILLGAVATEHSGVASGVLNACRQVGGVLGIALFGSLIQVQSNFVQGLHLSALIAGCATWLVCLLAWSLTQRQF